MRHSFFTAKQRAAHNPLRLLSSSVCVVALLCSATAGQGQDTAVRKADAKSPDGASDDETKQKITRPFLWSVTKGEGDDATKHYLFGTIHVPDEWITTLHPAARRAFDDSTAAYFEVDMVRDQAAQAEAISLPRGEKLEDLVPEELLKRLDARLKAINPILNRNLLPPCRVVVWPLLIGNLEAQMRKLGQPPMDLKLYVEATQGGKTVGGLEDPRSQLETLISLPNEEQVAFLKASLDQMDEDEDEKETQLEETMRMYAEGRDEEFLKFFTDEFNDLKIPDALRRKILKALLDDRNEAIARRVDELVSAETEGSHFFAVGTAHLLGRNSVQDYLKKLGYRIERVEVEE